MTSADLTKRAPSRRADKRILVIGSDLVMPKLFYFSGMLRAEGLEYDIYTHDVTEISWLYAQGAGASIIEAPPHSRRVMRWLRDFATVWRRIKSANYHHADLFSDYHIFASIIYLVVLKAKRIPIVLWCRGELLDWPDFSWWQRAYFRIAMRWASSVILKERYMKPLLVGLNAYDPDKMIELHNSIPMPEPRQGRLFEHEPIRLLFMNSFKTWRNVSFFVEVAEGLRERGVAFTMKIVGEKDSSPGLIDEAAKLRERITAAGLWDRISVHPFTESPEEYYLSSDVFLISGKIIFCNYGLLEAMGRELVPLVDSTDPGHSLIIEDGVSGLALSMDAALWADAIAYLGSHKEEARAMAKAARARIEEEFSTEKMFELYAHATNLRR